MSKYQELELPEDILNAIDLSNKFNLPLMLSNKSIDDSQVISILQIIKEPFIINFYNNNITDYGALMLAKFSILYFSFEKFRDALVVDGKNENMVFIGSNHDISDEFRCCYESAIRINNHEDELTQEISDENNTSTITDENITIGQSSNLEEF